jgi:cyclin A
VELPAAKAVELPTAKAEIEAEAGTAAPVSGSGSMDIDLGLEQAAVAVPPAGGAAIVAAAIAAAPTHVNIDADNNDPNVVVEYVDEIYQYLRGLENKFRPKPGYMKKQRDINHGMRTILVDWLVEVAEEYKLNSHTLYIAVGYIDRFLSEMSVNRGKLQLVGVTSMLLASKYEEIYPPAVDEFVYITDNTYTRDQILKMENLVLKVLQFDMGAVTAYSFAERFLKAADADDRTRHLTQYLMELTLQDGERYLKYRPSVVAAAAVCVTLDTLQMPCWVSENPNISNPPSFLP